MKSHAGPSHIPMIGEDVTLLIHTDDRPTWTVARIYSREPFIVEMDKSHADHFRGLKNVLVIHDSGRKYSKGEGRIGDLTETEDKVRIQFSDFHWESVDNRDNPRFNVKVQAIVRTILETNGTIQVDDQMGMTINLSLGGALLELSNPVSKGQLVEFRVSPEAGQTVRAMGIVAHTDVHGTTIGVSFIDYIGAARYTLHQYLSKLAA